MDRIFMLHFGFNYPTFIFRASKNNILKVPWKTSHSRVREEISGIIQCILTSGSLGQEKQL